MQVLEFLDSFGGLLTVIVTNLATWGSTFLFFKQRRKGMEIENEAKQSDEWRKLYLESQEDSRKKEAKIDELYKRIDEQNKRLLRLEGQVQRNAMWGCYRHGCEQRLSNSNSSDLPEA